MALMSKAEFHRDLTDWQLAVSQQQRCMLDAPSRRRGCRSQRESGAEPEEIA